MLPSRPLVIVIVLILAAETVGAQSLPGIYTTTSQQGGSVTLVMRDAGAGRVSGTLSGNGNSFELEGASRGGDAEGTLAGTGVKMFFGVRLLGDSLLMILAEPGADGQPDFQRATQLSFRRSGGAGGSVASGNPLGGGRAATSDRYAGAWTSKDVALSLTSGGGMYSGTLTHQGSSYPISLKDEGPGLSGTFTAGGSSYDVLVKLENGNLMLNTAGTTYLLARTGAGAGNPLAGGTTGGSGGARSPQDEQMFRMFIANAWCSFSYSSGSTYATTGGTTRTEKIFLNPNGTVSGTRNSETTSSGQSGQAYLGNQGGTQGYWKFENGQLYLGPSPQQLAPQQFKMTYNSNGYPIPIVNGTEYMICR